MLIKPDRALQHMAHIGAIPHMILRKQRHLVMTQPIDTRVTDVPDGVAVAPQQQHTQGSRHARAVFVHRALRQQPAVDRRQHTIQCGGDTPGFRRGVIIGEQPAHRVLGSLAAGVST